MAAKTLDQMITITDETLSPLGDSNHTWTADRQIKITVNDDDAYQALPRYYAVVGTTYAEVCGRCGGKGNVGYGPYGGICFTCSGGGICGGWIPQDELDAMLTRWARRALREAKAAAKKMAEIRAARDAWFAGHADLAAWAKALTPNKILTEDDSYTREAATQAEAETPLGREGERFIRSQQIDGTSTWWALFVVDEPIFDQYGTKADDMIRRVRADFALNPQETGYLTKVMASAITEAAELAPVVAASRHAAPAKTRTDITGEVVFIKDLDDNGFGPRVMVVTEGRGGYAGITWKTFTGAASARSLLKGDTVQVRATVKKAETYKGIAQDIVERPVFTRIEEDDEPAAPAAPVAPAPAPAPVAPVEAAAAPQAARQAPARTGRRQSLGEAAVSGWELLYDKPRQAAQVARNNGGYALICTTHKTVRPLARLAEERDLRKTGGWCTECSH